MTSESIAVEIAPHHPVVTAPGAPRDKFAARVAGRLLAMSRTPLLAAARALLAEGADPRSVLILKHTVNGTESVRTTVATAARLARHSGSQTKTE